MARSRDRKGSNRRAPKARPPMPAIRLRRVTFWRRGGRFATPHARGARKTTFLAQVNRAGKIVDVLEMAQRHHIVKSVLPSAIEAQRNPGMIVNALMRTNALTSVRGAKRVQIRVSYTLPDGTRDKFTLDHVTLGKDGRPLPRVEISNLTVGSIIQALRTRGLRTRYQIQAVDWSKVKDVWRKTGKGGRVNVSGKTQVGRRTQVDHMQITVDIEK